VICVKALNQIEKNEISAVFRAVNAIALRNVYNYIDYKTVLLRLAKVVTDPFKRATIIDCIEIAENDHQRFCCILQALNLSDLEKKYCV